MNKELNVSLNITNQEELNEKVEYTNAIVEKLKLSLNELRPTLKEIITLMHELNVFEPDLDVQVEV